MTEITKVAITKNPGYGCSSTMFQEKIVLTSNSIEYRVIPHMNNKRDAEKHWSYKSNSESVKGRIKEAFDEFGKIICLDENEGCCDIGSLEFVITYSDKTKIEKIFWRPPTDFKAGFMAIRNLIPHTEKMPRFLEYL